MNIQRFQPMRARGSNLRPRARIALAAALLLPLVACDTDRLLEVDDIDVTRPEALFDPANLPALRATAIGDFAVAYGGTSSTTGNIGLVHATGLMSDELWHSGTFGQNRELDRRSVNEFNGFVASLSRNLYRARTTTRLANQSFQQNNPESPQRAEMRNLEGYVYLAFAENFCSGVPFSEQVGGQFEYGSPETTQQVYDRSIAAFVDGLALATAARNAAGATNAVRNAAEMQQRLATMGRARALVNLNRHAEAAALVRDIPTSWVYNLEYSDNTGRQNNGLWGNNHGRREIALASREGGVGVEYRRGNATALNTPVTADPRVPWSVVNGAADTRSVHFFQLKYPTQGSPIALASGIQARLIEAEAALNRGQSADYLPILNALRQTIGLANLADPGTAAGRVSQYFEERAMWQFGTAQRLSDMRRLMRQYGRPLNQVFPTGVYTRPGRTTPDSPVGAFVERPDGTYGNNVTLPLPFDEQNNRNFQQCLNRDA
jgi:starch-binding outer membrane protein, SusD/RagB family